MLAARRRDETEAAMRRFLAKHAATTTGTLSCFDRLLFKGTCRSATVVTEGRRAGRRAGKMASRDVHRKPLIDRPILIDVIRRHGDAVGRDSKQIEKTVLMPLC